MATLTGKKGKKVKKNNKLSLGEFLTDGNTVNLNQVNQISVPVKIGDWGDDGDDDDDDRGVRTQVIALPTAPRATRILNDDSIPHHPPFSIYVSNLPYDINEGDLYDIFADQEIVAMSLPRDDGDSRRLRGFGNIEFATRDDLIEVLAMPEPMVHNRRIRIGPYNDNDTKRRNNRYDNFTSQSDADRSSTGNWRDGPRATGGGGDRDGGGFRRSYHSGYNRDREDRPSNDSTGGGNWRTTDRPPLPPPLSPSAHRRNYDRDRDSGNGFRRQLDSRTRIPREPEMSMERPKLVLQPRTLPLPQLPKPRPESDDESRESEHSIPVVRSTPVPAAKVFGEAKPVDTAAREREIEERLQEMERQEREKRQRKKEADAAVAAALADKDQHDVGKTENGNIDTDTKHKGGIGAPEEVQNWRVRKSNSNNSSEDDYNKDDRKGDNHRDNNRGMNRSMQSNGVMPSRDYPRSEQADRQAWASRGEAERDGGEQDEDFKNRQTTAALENDEERDPKPLEDRMPQFQEPSRPSLSRWHKQLNSSANVAHGVKSICERQSPPSSAVTPVEEYQREESIHFYGSLVQQSQNDTSFLLPEGSLLAAAEGLPIHRTGIARSSCAEPTIKARKVFDVSPEISETCSSPNLGVAEDENDTSWMNITTTMIESCSALGPTDWWQVDSMFMDAGGLCGAELESSQTISSVINSSGTTGEQLRMDTHKTASPDVCRIEFDKSPRRSFVAVETSVNVHDVCNKTFEGGLAGSGMLSTEEHTCQAAATTPAPSASSCSSGTVASASSVAAVSTITVQQRRQQQQRTSKKQSDSITISGRRNSSNSSSISRQQTSAAVVDSNISVNDCTIVSAPTTTSTATSSPDHHGICDEMLSSIPPLFLSAEDWAETCISAGLELSNTIEADEHNLQQHPTMWISSPTSSSTNIMDAELEHELEDYYFTVTKQAQQIPHQQNTQAQKQSSAATSNIATRGGGSNLLLGESRDGAVGRRDVSSETAMTISLPEEIEQLSSVFHWEAANNPSSTSTATANLPSPNNDFQLGVGDSEAVSLNIFKLLQDDFSSSIITDQPVASTGAHQHQRGMIGSAEGTSINILAVDSSSAPYCLPVYTEISSVLVVNPLQPPPLVATFGDGPDQINSPNRLPQVVGGGSRTAIKRKTSSCSSAHGANGPSAAKTSRTGSSPTSTTTTNATFGNTQGEHNYFTVEDSDVQDVKHPKPFDDRQNTSDATAMDTKLTLAHSKNTTLRLHEGCVANQGISTATQLNSTSRQDLFQLPSKTMTTTTAADSSNVSHHHMPPQATISTSDLTNDILDLEEEKFDLLSFINTNDGSLEFDMFMLPSLPPQEGNADQRGDEEEQGEDDDEEEAAVSESNHRSSNSDSRSGDTEDNKSSNQPPSGQCQRTSSNSKSDAPSKASPSSSSSSSPSKLRLRQHNAYHLVANSTNNSNCSLDSLSSVSSVCGDSDVSSSATTPTPKRRGRPPKPVSTVRDRSQYGHLSEADWRYREQRDKNNEASRKSRISRKDRELKLESEADQLSLQHQKLSYEEQLLHSECQKWRKAVMKLALL